MESEPGHQMLTGSASTALECTANGSCTDRVTIPVRFAAVPRAAELWSLFPSAAPSGLPAFRASAAPPSSGPPPGPQHCAGALPV
eukprot:1158488-Pelagomonas_calceolata.AAC.4